MISDPLTIDDFNADWLAIEVWAQQVATILGKPTLLIPRKNSLRAADLTQNWLAIEQWANNL